jgi:hypothetical protein
MAETCGWTDLWWAPIGDLRSNPELQGKPPGGSYDCPVPHYLTDLNAVHEAVKRLTPDQLHTYHATLVAVYAGWAGTDWYDGYESGIDATAAQRVEAILRARGKWRDSP